MACEVYEVAEEEYGEDALELYVDHLSLLCNMEERKTMDVEGWNYELLHEIYEKGREVPGITEDYRWKRLETRLKPLFEKREEGR